MTLSNFMQMNHEYDRVPMLAYYTVFGSTMLMTLVSMVTLMPLDHTIAAIHMLSWFGAGLLFTGTCLFGLYDFVFRTTEARLLFAFKRYMKTLHELPDNDWASIGGEKYLLEDGWWISLFDRWNKPKDWCLFYRNEIIVGSFSGCRLYRRVYLSVLDIVNSLKSKE